MSPVQATCPGCGAPIDFRIGSSMVTVCQYCHSVVARGDRKLEDLGKIAYLAETDSPIEIEQKGRYQGHAFEVLGLARLGHEAGGTWDEWYLAFDDGRWGWLAEAQGRFYLTFAVDVKERDKIPAYDALQLEQRFLLRQGDPPMMVAEKGEGRPIGARGEIPYRLVPDQLYTYADLSGPNGRFGTLDYGDTPPSVYLGREVALDELQLPHKEETYEHAPKQVAAIQLNCPQCGGGLELKAPDKAERVGCPFCGALLDASQGNLKLLQALKGPMTQLPIPIGSVGRFGGVEYTAIGYLKRGIELDNTWYYWHEYLLYNDRLGFRWLASSDRHWSFIEPLPPGSVQMAANNALYNGKQYRWFQRGVAEVKVVLGEFYWKVAAGEQVATGDYIRPPEMLSREITQSGTGRGEVSWSKGTYLPVRDVERAFGLKKPLPYPSNIAPNQPFPFKNIYRYWAIFTAIAVLLGLVFLVRGQYRKVFEQDYPLPAVTNSDEAQAYFAGPFDLHDRENVDIEASAQGTNFWLWIDGDLIDEKSGTLQGFSLPIEYYEGVEDGESWSEGSREASQFLSAVPGGQYTLRMEVHGEPRNPPLTLHVRVRQDVPRISYWLLALLGVSAVPLAVAAYQISFESRRWSDSNVK